MTLGERIQELRRAQGMTQEALADTLGVSRQAVSKWESDITIPEVDKLIALSKLFAVPVGVLLGVEKPPAEGGASAGESESAGTEELTERELMAVETIVRRYLEESRAHEPKPAARRAVLLWAAAGAAALMLGAWWMFSRLERSFNAQINGLYTRVDTIDRTVDGLNNIPWLVQNAIEEQNSPLSSWSCEPMAVTADRTIIYNLTATPKEYVSGMGANFRLEDTAADWGYVEAGIWNGTSFTARIEMPLANNVIPTVILINEESQLNVELPPQNLPWADMFRIFPADATLSGSYDLSRSGRLTLDMEADILAVSGVQSLGPEVIWPEKVLLRVEYGSQVLEEISLEAALWDRRAGQGRWTVPVQGEYEVSGGAALHLVLCVRDNFETETEDSSASFDVKPGSGNASGGVGAVTVPAPPAGT